VVQYLWENVLNRKRNEGDLFSFLKQSYLFQDLSNKELEFVCQIVHHRQYRAGEKIFAQNDPGVGMYLILSGCIDIVMKSAKGNSEQVHEDVFITRLEKGDFFGELSLVENPSFRSASAVSIDRSNLIGFFKPDLMQVIQRNPITGNKISMRLCEILGRRLRETTEKITDLVTAPTGDGVSTAKKKKNEKHFTS